MDASLRDRIVRALDTLPDDKGYQVLDYVSFLESRYAQRAAPPDNVFARMSAAVEDTLRASRVNASTVAQAMGLMNQAMGILGGVAAAGKSVVNDVTAVGKQVANDLANTGQRAAATAPTAPSATPPAAPPTTDTGSSGQTG